MRVPTLLYAVASLVILGGVSVDDVIAQKKVTVAVLYFDNLSEDKKWEPLSKGIADMLITDMAKIKQLRVVERSQLEKIVKEIQLQGTKYFDQKTAQKLGSGLGASIVCTGSYMVLDDITMNVRIVDVGTGEILQAETVTGRKNDWLRLKAELFSKLLSGLKVKPDVEKNGERAGNMTIDDVVERGVVLAMIDQGLLQRAKMRVDSLKKYSKNPMASIPMDGQNIDLALRSQTEMLKNAAYGQIYALLNNPDKGFYRKVQQVLWSFYVSPQDKLAIVEAVECSPDIDMEYPLDTYVFGEELLFYKYKAYMDLRDYKSAYRVSVVFRERYPMSLHVGSVVEAGIKMADMQRKQAEYEISQASLEAEMAAAGNDHNSLEYLQRKQELLVEASLWEEVEDNARTILSHRSYAYESDQEDAIAYHVDIIMSMSMRQKYADAKKYIAVNKLDQEALADSLTQRYGIQHSAILHAIEKWEE